MTLPEVEATIGAADGTTGVGWGELQAKWQYALLRLSGKQTYPEAPPAIWQEAADVNFAMGDVSNAAMSLFGDVSAAPAAVERLKAALASLRNSHDVCSEANEGVWAPAPIPLPGSGDKLESFTAAVASDALGCWQGLHGRAAADASARCEIAWESLILDPAYDLIHSLVATGAHNAGTTCPAVWAKTAYSVLQLGDFARHELIWPADTGEVGLFSDSEDQTGEIASDLYNFLTGGAVEIESCNDLREMPDAVELRIDLAADAAEFDRVVGGWFGRAGAATDDWMDVWIVLSTWSRWRYDLISYDAVLDPSCHDGIEQAFTAAETLEWMLQSLHSHVRGWSGWLPDSQRDGDVSDALERDIELAIARLEDCVA